MKVITVASFWTDRIAGLLRRPIGSTRPTRNRDSFRKSNVGGFGAAGVAHAIQMLEDRTLLSAGELDPTFGDGGVVVTNVQDKFSSQYINDLVIQPDGKIITVGVAAPIGDRYDHNYDISIARFNPDGGGLNQSGWDDTFGDAGEVRLFASTGYDSARSVALRPDGRIVIAATVDADGFAPTGVEGLKAAVFQLLPDGQRDLSFGTDGMVIVETGPDQITDMVLQSDGKILIVGAEAEYNKEFHITRLNTDGSLDNTFGDSGSVLTDIGDYSSLPTRVILQDDGRILVAGRKQASSYEGVVVRYNADGSLDESFGDAGISVHQISGIFVDLALLDDGKILASGNSGSNPVLMKLNSDGSRDNTFGNNGRAVMAQQSRGGSAHKIHVHQDGRIDLLQAYNTDDTTSRWSIPAYPDKTGYSRRSVARLTANGNPDTTFYEDGLQQLGEGENGFGEESYGDVYAAEWLDDGRLVVGGTGNLHRFTADYLADDGGDSSDLSTGFDADGSLWVRITVQTDDAANGVTLQPDGKILVVGRTEANGLGERSTSYNDVTSAGLLRYDTSGQLDVSFDGFGDYFPGGDGRVVVGDYDSTGSQAHDVIATDDGQIYAAFEYNRGSLFGAFHVNEFGQHVQSDYVFYNGSGAIANDIIETQSGTFAMAGSSAPHSAIGILNKQLEPVVEQEAAITPWSEQFEAVAEASDGKLVAVGWAEIEYTPWNEDSKIAFTVVRHNEDGTHDTSFSGDGIVLANSIGTYDRAYDVAVLPDGRMLVVGTTQAIADDPELNDLESSFFVARLLPDGQFDTSFGENGVMVRFSDAEARAIELQDDGNFVVFGNIGNAIAAVRFLADGSLDDTFGTGGVALASGTPDALFHKGTDLVLQPDGAFVGVGSVMNPDGRDDFVVVRFQGDAAVAPPSITHVSPDSGRHDRDAITNHQAVSFHGVGTPETTVTVSIDGTEVGETAVDAAGVWTFDHSATQLPEGAYSITATTTLGLVSSVESHRFDLTIDLTAPEPSTDMYHSGGVTTTSLSRFYGTAEFESSVEVFVDGVLWEPFIYSSNPLRLAHAGDYGRWSLNSYNYPYPGVGWREFTNVVTDLAGNVSGVSDPLSILILNTSPVGNETTISTTSTTVQENSIASLANVTSVVPYVRFYASYTATGTATAGRDYYLTRSAIIENDPVSLLGLIDDTVYEGDESLEVTFASGTDLVNAPVTVSVTILEDDAPTLTDFDDLAIMMDTATSAIPFTIGNFAYGVDVPIVLTSSNPALVANSSIVLSGAGADRSLVITPNSGQTGSTIITVTAGHGAVTVTRTFALRVGDQSDVPIVAPALADVQMLEDQTRIISFAVSDNATPAGQLIVTAHSADGDLIDSSGLELASSGGTYGLRLTPHADASGQTEITIQVADTDGFSAFETFNLTVTEVADDLELILPGVQTIDEDTTLVFSADSGNPIVVKADSDVVFDATVFVDSGSMTWRREGRSYSGNTFHLSGTKDELNAVFETLEIRLAENLTGANELHVKISSGIHYANTVVDYSSQGNQCRATSALGAPDDFHYGAGGDNYRAWSPATRDGGIEHLTLGFESVYSTGVSIREVSGNGFVRKIELRDPDGVYHVAWEGIDPTAAGEIRHFEPRWAKTAYLVDAVRVTIDSNHALGEFEAIDSVELLSDIRVEGVVPILVNPIEDAPRFSREFNSATILEDEVYQFSVWVGDAESPRTALTIEATTDNSVLLPESGIEWSWNEQYLQYKLTPAENLSGSAQVTFTVTDEAGLTDEYVVTLVVTAVNDVPTMTVIGDQTVSEDGTMSFTIEVDDVESATDLLFFTAFVEHEELLPLDGITIVGRGPERMMILTPDTNRFGETEVTIELRDPYNGRAVQEFVLTVTAVDDLPVNQIPEDSESNADALTVFSTATDNPISVSDNDPGDQLLHVTLAATNGTLTLATADNLILTSGDGIDDASLSIVGVSSSINFALDGLVFEPNAGFNGTAEITITTDDRKVAASTSGAWAATVIDAEQYSSSSSAARGEPDAEQYEWNSYRNWRPRGIEDGGFLTVGYDTPVQAEAITIVGLSSELKRLDVLGLDDVYTTVWIRSGQTLPISDEIFDLTVQFAQTVGLIKGVRVYEDRGAVDAIRLVDSLQFEAAGGSDIDTIQIIVSDPPQILDVANWVTDEDVSVGPIPFVVADAESFAEDLVVTGATSSELIESVSIGGNGANRTVTVVPVADGFGTATIQLTVTDTDGRTATDVFDVIINPVDDAPTIQLHSSAIETNEDTTTIENRFAVNDIDTPISLLTVVAKSSDQLLVEDASIQLLADGTIRVTPVLNAYGTVDVTLTVSDGVSTADAVFTLEILPVNDAPDRINVFGAAVSEAVDNFRSDVQVATFTTHDVDPGDQHSYALISGDGDTDNGRFVVVGDTLFLKSGEILDFETQPEYLVRIESSDNELSITASFTISVTDETETLVVMADAVTVEEPGGLSTLTIVRNTSLSADWEVNIANNLSPRLSSPVRVMIPAGETLVTFDVSGIDNPIVDGDQIAALLFDDGSATAGQDIQVTDDDIAGFETFNADALRVVETGLTGSGGVDVFEVALKRQPLTDVTIVVGSQDESEAVANPASITFTTENWDVRQQIEVVGVDDAIVDGAVLAVFDLTVDPSISDDAFDGLAVTTEVLVTDDDVATVDLADVLVNENDGTAELTVSLSHAVDVPFDLEIRFTEGTASSSDFDGATRRITFADFSVDSQTIVIPIDDDLLVEGLHLFSAAVVSSTDFGTRQTDFTDTATVTIVDDDTAIFGVQDVVVVEGETAVFTVTLSNPVDIETVVDFTLSEGTATAADFTLQDHSVTFAAGTTTLQTVSVPITDDVIVEGTHGFVVNLLSATDFGTRSVDLSSPVSTATGTIHDDDSATVQIDNAVSVSEADGNLVFVVSIDQAVDTDLMIEVHYADGSATSADYDSTVDQIVFTAGSTASQMVVVPVTDDFIVEGTHSFSASLVLVTDVGDRMTDLTSTSMAEILDNDVATFTIDDVSVDEGTGLAELIVRLDREVDSDVSLDVVYSDQSATSDDYDSTTDSIQFSAGSTAAQVVQVQITNDLIVEGDHQFLASLQLDVLAGDRMVDVSSTATIVVEDEDVAIFQIDNVVVREGAGTAEFTITPGHAIDTEFSLDVVFAGNTATSADYNSATQRVVFEPGDNGVRTIVVPIIQDDIVEGTHGFDVSLGSSTVIGNRNIDLTDRAIGTITDDDQLGFVVDDVAVEEDAGMVTFVIQPDRSADIDVVIDVTWQTGSADNNDFGFTAQQVVLPAGSTDAVLVTTVIVDDQIVEGSHEFSVHLSSPTDPGTRVIDLTDRAVGTIRDDDTAVFTIDDASVNEEAGEVVLSVSVDRPLDIDMLVNVSFESLLATSADFDGRTIPLLFTAGAGAGNSLSVTVPIVNDGIVEGADDFRVALNTHTVVGDRTVVLDDLATVTIVDDDMATFRIHDVSVDESSREVTLQITLDAPVDKDVDLDVVFSSQTAGEDDFGSATQRVSIPAFDVETISVVVPLADDFLVEGPEQFAAALQFAFDTTSHAITVGLPATVTIADDDTAGFAFEHSFGNTSVGETESDDTVNVRLTSRPLTDVVIQFASSDAGEFILQSSSVVFTTDNWDQIQAITVTGVNDDVEDGLQVGQLVASIDLSSDSQFVNLTSQSLTVENHDDDQAGLTLTTDQVTVGEGQHETVAVRLNSQPESDVVVRFTNEDLAQLGVSVESLTFTADNWSQSQSFTVTGLDDQFDDGDVVSTIGLSVAAGEDSVYMGMTRQVAVTIVDNDSAGVLVTATDGSTLVSEDATSDILTVVLAARPQFDVVISVSSSDGTEVLADVSSLSFTVDNWDVPQQVTVTGVNDNLRDGDQSAEVLFSVVASQDAAFADLTDVSISVTNADNVEFTLDVDDDSQGLALTDGVLVLRFLSGFSGTALTSGAVNTTGGNRIDSGEISTWLDGHQDTFLDVDGDGVSRALTDGILMLRYLAGFRGSSLISGAVNPVGQRTSAAQIVEWLDPLAMPVVGLPAQGPLPNTGLVNETVAYDGLASEKLASHGYSEVREFTPLNPDSLTDAQSVGSQDWRKLLRLDELNRSVGSRRDLHNLDDVFTDAVSLPLSQV